MRKCVPLLMFIVIVLSVGFIPVVKVNGSAADAVDTDDIAGIAAGAAAGITIPQGEIDNIYNQISDAYEGIGGVDGAESILDGAGDELGDGIGDVINDAKDGINNLNGGDDTVGTTFKSSTGSLTGFNYNYTGSSGDSSAVAATTAVSDSSDDDIPFAEPAGEIDKSSASDSIKWLQWCLNKLDYDMSAEGINGVYNDATVTAVKQFQSENGLPVTGTVDEATKSKLKEKYNDKLLLEAQASAAETVTETQTQAAEASSLQKSENSISSSGRTLIIVLAVVLAVSAVIIIVILIRSSGLVKKKTKVEYIDDFDFFDKETTENTDKTEESGVNPDSEDKE